MARSASRRYGTMVNPGTSIAVNAGAEERRRGAQPPQVAAHTMLILGIGILAGCSPNVEPAESYGALPSHCFVLPGAGTGVTQSYRVSPGGALEATGEARGPQHHMRAAFHPSGHRLYLNSVGPEGWAGQDGGTVPPGIQVRTYDYDPESCRIGAFLGATDMGAAAPNGERVYGLAVDPSGRFLYQTTASLKRIRLYDLDDEGLPVPRTDFEVTRNGAHVCAQTRRLALHPDRQVLYANCNNRDAGPEVDEALQVWRVSGDGSLALIEHQTLWNMNGGVLDPVIHPSGDWLYHPVGTTSLDAPRGSGGYVLVFRIDEQGALSLHDQVPVRVVEEGDSVADPTNAMILPMTFTLHPDGSAAVVALHASLEAPGSPEDPELAYVYPHEFVVYDVQGGGGRLVEQFRMPALKSTRWSSHHGGTLTSVGGDLFYHSYLTDYDSITGGVLQNLRVNPDGALIPLEPPWIDTGLRNGRQPIAVR